MGNIRKFLLWHRICVLRLHMLPTISRKTIILLIGIIVALFIAIGTFTGTSQKSKSITFKGSEQNQLVVSKPMALEQPIAKMFSLVKGLYQ